MARFWAKVDKTDGCWLWTAASNPGGYGVFGLGGRKGGTYLAHRVSWVFHHGSLPAGAHLDHLCHTPACVRPAHLRLVTNKQNHENLSGAYSSSKSGVRGVSWDAARGLWRATVTHNYRQVTVGRFETIEEATAAVVQARHELFTHSQN